MKNKDFYYLEFPLKKFVKKYPLFSAVLYRMYPKSLVDESKYPLFSAVLYRMYPKSLVDESLQSDDYIVRYNGFMLEVGRKSDKWQVK